MHGRCWCQRVFHPAFLVVDVGPLVLFPGLLPRSELPLATSATAALATELLAFFGGGGGGGGCPPDPPGGAGAGVDPPGEGGPGGDGKGWLSTSAMQLRIASARHSEAAMLLVKFIGQVCPMDKTVEAVKENCYIKNRRNFKQRQREMGMWSEMNDRLYIWLGIRMGKDSGLGIGNYFCSGRRAAWDSKVQVTFDLQFAVASFAIWIRNLRDEYIKLFCPAVFGHFLDPPEIIPVGQFFPRWIKSVNQA